MPEDILTNVLIFKNMLWLEDYAFRMERWLKGEKIGPLRIDAELHRRCNLNCVMCARRNSQIDMTEESKKIEMPTQKWIEIVRESGEMGTRAWNISGLGEPMCKPQTLFDVMKTIKAYNMFGELTTNGTLWKEEYIKRTIKMNWDSVCVSIDAPDAAIHDSLRRVNKTFKKATKTVKLFAEWRNKMGMEVPCLTLNVVLNRLNYKKLPEMVKLAYNLGADAIFVEPMIVYTDLGEKIKLRENEIEELPKIIEEAKELGKEYNIVTTVTCETPEKNIQSELVKNTSDIRSILLEDAKKFNDDKILSIPCYSPWFFLMIRADGTAIHCGESKKIFDNIRNKSLEEIWFGQTLKDIREQFLQGKLPEYCNMCRPNVIEDTREMRRSVLRYRRAENLQKKIIDLLEENMELKRQVFRLRMKKGLKLKDLNRLKELEEKEKELLRFKNSLSFKLGKKVGETKIGKMIKKQFGVYV
jgi:MoaA/NifB/PqqE/SkfB family radical SAM enzyme